MCVLCASELVFKNVCMRIQHECGILGGSMAKSICMRVGCYSGGSLAK